MIDLDSLCSFKAFAKIGFTSARYIKCSGLRVGKVEVKVLNAMQYLYLLVICIAEVWLLGKENNSVNANEILVGSHLSSNRLTRFLPGHSSLVDDDAILNVLSDYRRHFTRIGGFVSAVPELRGSPRLRKRIHRVAAPLLSTSLYISIVC
jgi:hypothetical protein